MKYDRKIKYFDYKKDGERLRGAGFVKMEVRGESCKLQVQISGLHMTDTFSKQVYLVAKDREEVLCPIELQDGKGTIQKQLPVDNLCNGISYGEVLAIRIPIAAGYELYCRMSDNIEQESSGQDAGVGAAGQDADAVSSSEVEQLLDVVSISETEQTTDRQEVITAEQNIVILEDFQVNNTELVDIKADNKKTNSTETKTMLADKWEQLSAIYPHIQPFQDERDYLQLGPEDFVVLGRRSYQLAHNSFLLHGYYNYEHLILTRQVWRNEERYYIGVPGNFYEREKQVALMFGFESFECKKEAADMGDYGYYMIRVDI